MKERREEKVLPLSSASVVFDKVHVHDFLVTHGARSSLKASGEP